MQFYLIYHLRIKRYSFISQINVIHAVIPEARAHHNIKLFPLQKHKFCLVIFIDLENNEIIKSEKITGVKQHVVKLFKTSNIKMAKIK